MASAGTIFDENTTSTNPASNTAKATESVCPKGWTLPNTTQITSIGPTGGSDRYMSAFSPVLGGVYGNGVLYNENTYAFWYGSEAFSGAGRYLLGYNGNAGSLYNSHYNDYRAQGMYIRCVAKQKTITDLAYMQDVTDEVNFGEVWRI